MLNKIASTTVGCDNLRPIGAFEQTAKAGLEIGRTAVNLVDSGIRPSSVILGPLGPACQYREMAAGGGHSPGKFYRFSFAL